MNVKGKKYSSFAGEIESLDELTVMFLIEQMILHIFFQHPFFVRKKSQDFQILPFNEKLNKMVFRKCAYYTAILFEMNKFQDVHYRMLYTKGKIKYPNINTIIVDS